MAGTASAILHHRLLVPSLKLPSPAFRASSDCRSALIAHASPSQRRYHITQDPVGKAACVEVERTDFPRRSTARAFLFQLLTATLVSTHPSASQAAVDSERRGIGRYIKKKKLDPLDSYVPAVIAAKNQLQRAGSIMKDDLQGARGLLRNGAFDGLRDNIRAIGEYAEQSGAKDAKKLPDNFFQSVQGFDFTLFQAKRNEQPVGADSDKALKAAVSSIDDLLATVPKDILDESAKIVEAVESSFQAQPAAPKDGSDKQLDQLMQLVPTQSN